MNDGQFRVLKFSGILAKIFQNPWYYIYREKGKEREEKQEIFLDKYKFIFLGIPFYFSINSFVCLCQDDTIRIVSFRNPFG